jgi:hypothetical protein
LWGQGADVRLSSRRRAWRHDTLYYSKIRIFKVLMWGWIEREGLTFKLRDYSVSQIWCIDASSSQDKMIVLASNSFEVKMSLCGDPESDVSLFFKVVCSTQEACARKHQECNLTWRGESKRFLGNKCT